MLFCAFRTATHAASYTSATRRLKTARYTRLGLLHVRGHDVGCPHAVAAAGRLHCIGKAQAEQVAQRATRGAAERVPRSVVRDGVGAGARVVSVICFGRLRWPGR